MARLPGSVVTATNAAQKAAHGGGSSGGRKTDTAARHSLPRTSASTAAVQGSSLASATGQKVSPGTRASTISKSKPSASTINSTTDAPFQTEGNVMTNNSQNKVSQGKQMTGSDSRPSAVPKAAPYATTRAYTGKSSVHGSAATAPATAPTGSSSGNKSVNGMKSPSSRSTATSTSSSTNNRKKSALSASSPNKSPDALYTLLGVTRAATAAEIGKAYRSLALLLHPDKVLHRLQQQRTQQEAGGGNRDAARNKNHAKTENKEGVHESAIETDIEQMRLEATRHFQELQRAYTILKDPVKRRLYDKTGLTGEDGEEPQSFEEAYAFYRHLFPEIDLSAIEKFKKDYLGSAAERDDIRDFCVKFKGELTHFFAYIPFSEKEHLPRYVRILTDFIEKKEVPEATKLTKKTIEHLGQQAEKMEKLAAREAVELEKQKICSSNQQP